MTYRQLIAWLLMFTAILLAATALVGCGGDAGELDPEPDVAAPEEIGRWCCASRTAQGVRIDTFCGPNEEWSVHWSNLNQNPTCWHVPTATSQ